MTYAVKEIYYTIQGEGAKAGKPSVFCRFSGCNLWSGIEADRSSAVCQFCDTDFFGIDGEKGGKYESPQELAAAIDQCWGAEGKGRPFVVCTGGEPLLQLDEPLVNALHDLNFEVGVETNGTLRVPNGIDWLCVSPKAHAECVVVHGDELKIVFPQQGIDPADFEAFGFSRFFLQPMDGPQLEVNQKLAVEYCLRHPQWELSLQVQKMLGAK